MQRNETIKNLFPGYYRKHDQDMETLADLTKRAKGDERSINEFARVCGVSPSTISRLINKKNTTPNKDSLIKAIADNAVPESGVTLDMLLQAHGLEKISVYEGKERKSESVYRGCKAPGRRAGSCASLRPSRTWKDDAGRHHCQ